MNLAVCAGSFDPITLGHLDVISRADQVFDRVVVAVGANSTKNPLLDAETRVEIVRQATAGMAGVEVRAISGLLVDFCREVGARAIVKGLRDAADLAGELPMARMNRHLAGVETVFLLSDPKLAHISSTLVKEVAGYGVDISAMVPPAAIKPVQRALGRLA